jgi:hypothetical protein
VTYSEVDGERIAKNISIRKYSHDEDWEEIFVLRIVRCLKDN